jgi:hypothetical protein
MRNSSPQSRAVAGLLASIVCGLAGPGLAAEPDPRVAAAFGNTIVSTYPDGRSQKIWLHPDGAWTGLSRSHEDMAGRWTWKNGKVCLRQKIRPTLPFSYCAPLPQDAQVGAAWTAKDFAGTPIQLKLVRGVQAAG